MPLWDIQERQLENVRTQAASPRAAAGLHTESDKHGECCTINEELNQLKNEMRQQGKKGRKE